MSCGCGGSNCSGGCGCISASEVVLQPAHAGVRCQSAGAVCGSGCSSCNSTPCCCSSNSATPAPFYGGCNTPQCTENHCQQIIYNYFATAICIQYAFNMPDCGETASIYFQNVKVLTTGSYLWNADFGYLEVISFNPQTGQTTVKNNCQEGNASIGTNIPACTCFDVVDPPNLDNDPGDFPYVATDFVAPNNGDCITINVTSVNGLSEGGKIAIATGFYVLDSIVSPTQIRICNEGEGITPGTTVIALDEAGQYQYPITTIQNNPCTSDSVEDGVVVGCASGILSPLETPAEGDVLVVSDVGDSLSKFVTAGLTSDNDSIAAVPTETIAATDTYTTAVISQTLSNTNPHKVMQVLVIVSLTFELACAPTADIRDVPFQIDNQVNGGGWIEMIHNRCNIGDTTDTQAFAIQLVAHGLYTIPVSGSSLLQFRASVANASVSGPDIIVQDLRLQATTFGVAI